MYLVQIAVGERAHIARGLANLVVDQTVLAEDVVLAKDRHDHVLLQNLDGAPRYEVDGRKEIAPVDQRVARRRVGRLELH